MLAWTPQQYLKILHLQLLLLPCSLQHYPLTTTLLYGQKRFWLISGECLQNQQTIKKWTMKRVGFVLHTEIIEPGQLEKCVCGKGRRFESRAGLTESRPLSRWEMHLYSSTSTVKVPLNNVRQPTTQVLGSSQVYNKSKTLQ